MITNPKKGFTLIESLVAIGILLVSVMSTLGLAQASLSSSMFARDQVIASFLAEEGVEIIKNMRDDNMIDYLTGGERTWLSGLTQQVSVIQTATPCLNQTCRVDAFQSNASDRIQTCSGAGCVLRVNPSGWYGHNPSWTESKFSRNVLITSNGKQAEIVSTVSWNHRGENRSVVVREFIYKWQ